MTLSVTHSYVSSIGETTPSGGPGGTVGPTEWNANHTLTGTVSPAQGGTGITSGLGVTYFSSATVIADSGTLSANQLIVGGGANGAPATIGSLGTTSQVLHGNASGNPSFGAVNLGSEVAGTLSTANLQTATTAVFGIVKPDNSTITISSGVLTGTAASAGSSGQLQYNAGASAFGGVANTNTDGANLTSFRLSTTASLDWQSSSTSSGVAVSLFQDGPALLAQRNSITGTTAQTVRVYNASTSTGDYERGVFGWTDNSNVLTIGTQNAGTGSARNIEFIVGGTKQGDYGVTNSGAWTFAGVNFDIGTGNGGVINFDGGGGNNFIANGSNVDSQSGVVFRASGIGRIMHWDASNAVVKAAPGVPIGWSNTANDARQAADTALSRLGANVQAFGNGTQADHSGYFQWGGQGRVSANVTTTSTSLANITGLAATLQNGRNYTFSCEVIGTCSSSGGVQLALNTTSTSTGYTLLIDGYAIDAGNLVRGYSQQTAVGSAVIASTITNTSFHASLWGTITTSSSMVVNFQMAQQNLSATQTIAQRGSHSFFYDMA